MPTLFRLFTALCLVCPALTPAIQAAEPKDWPTLVDQFGSNPALQQRKDALIVRARNISKLPIARRALRYEDLGKHRTWLDTRALAMEGQPRQELFALASSDCVCWDVLLRELPLLAVGYRITGEKPLLGRIARQLEEAVNWSPMQRPGWSLCGPSPDPIPEGFDDGCWLGTGTGVRAITTTIAILPEGSLSDELYEKIHKLLNAEVLGVDKDWREGRSFFNGSPPPAGNQWIIPVCGWIEAILAVGRDRYPRQYEKAVECLMMSLDAQGPQGEFHEGTSYAMHSVSTLLSAASSMAIHGDRRAIDHPFIQKFPDWFASHIQPGLYFANTGDSGRGQIGRNGSSHRELFSRYVALFGHPTARWLLNHRFTGPSDDVFGALAAGNPGPEQEPPLWSYYEYVTRVTWLSGRESNASGFWLRGGHERDAHDQKDRGHVNFIAHGRPILIEAHTPSYGNPRIDTHYGSQIGHNVLDIVGGEVLRRKKPAPITVHRLGKKGGNLSVDPTACYPALEYWKRNVTWDTDRVTVKDQIEFKAGAQGKSLFRWHLGTQEEISVEYSKNKKSATTDTSLAKIQFKSTHPIEITSEMLPDNTVHLGKPVGEGYKKEYLHRCIIVQTRTPIKRWKVTMKLQAKELAE